MECSPVGFGVTPIQTRGPEATLSPIVPQRSGALSSSRGALGWAFVVGRSIEQTRNSAATSILESRLSGAGTSGFRSSAGDSRAIEAALGAASHRGYAGGSGQERGGRIFAAEVAEADGNRTRRGCVATPSYGFEVRGPHQRDNRFRGGVYRKKTEYPTASDRLEALS